MSTVTTVFEPVNTSNYTLAIISAFIALVSIVALIFFNKKSKEAPIPSDRNLVPARNRFKPLISLALFFVFLIAISTAFFSWLSTVKTTTVTINEDYIETPFGKAEWDNIKNIYVHEDQQVAPFSGRSVGSRTKLLMIIEMDGKTHTMSEFNYDIAAMSRTIDSFRKQKEEEKKERD